MLTSELDYQLPEDLIAQSPAEPRDASRLMVVDVGRGKIVHHTFRDLPGFLRPGDALVLNETKVLPARVEAKKPTGGGVELLFLKDLGPDHGETWEVLARPSKRLRPGLVLSVAGEQLELVKSLGGGHWAVSAPDVAGLLRRRGRMPLPPYIRPTPETEDCYQTVYARNEGSAAAPTAGFHFTERVLGDVERSGAEIARITLHVGVGTFMPVRT